MIDLITGLPGNAKTLYTIGFVRDWAAKENRPVFYSGIPELTLDWQEIEPEKWMEVPPKSIVVIDEAQRIFRNRSLGATPPKHVTDLETHRHLGIDLVFITQHPSLIDPAIRRLAGRHRHMVRIWGMEMSTVHKWDAVRDNCDKPASRKDSEQTKWAFDKSIYKLYKSSQEHTMKRSIPLRAKMLLLTPFVLAALGYFAYYVLIGKHKPVEGAAQVQAVAPDGTPKQVRPSVSEGQDARANFDPVQDAKQYVQMNTPRVVGLAFTAPKYDRITEPVRAPVPAACIQVGTPQSQKGIRCTCYSQQGTPLDVPLNMCMGFARNGWFQDFDADKDREQLARTQQSVKVMEGHDTVSSIAESRGAQAVVMTPPPNDVPRVVGKSITGG
jgi:hypothetical protein